MEHKRVVHALYPYETNVKLSYQVKLQENAKTVLSQTIDNIYLLSKLVPA